MNEAVTTVSPSSGSARSAPQGGRWLSRAWLAVLTMPVFGVLAFVVGEATLSAFGYSSGGDEPLWVSAIVDLATLVVWLIPCAAAVTFGRLARRSGAHGGLLPMVIGAIVGIAGTGLTIVTEIGNAL